MAGFRFMLVSDDHRYLGDFVIDRLDWSVGETFDDGEGRRFRIVRIEPARSLGAIQATLTVEQQGASADRWVDPQ